MPILGQRRGANDADVLESQATRANLSGFTVRHRARAYSHARVKTLAVDTGFLIFRLVRVSRNSRQYRRACRL